MTYDICSSSLKTFTRRYTFVIFSCSFSFIVELFIVTVFMPKLRERDILRHFHYTQETLSCILYLER